MKVNSSDDWREQNRIEQSIYQFSKVPADEYFTDRCRFAELVKISVFELDAGSPITGSTLA